MQQRQRLPGDAAASSSCSCFACAGRVEEGRLLCLCWPGWEGGRLIQGARLLCQQQCQACAGLPACAGFHFLYHADVGGLPAATVMDILRHPVSGWLGGWAGGSGEPS